MSDGWWEVVKDKASEWYSPGKFVTFSAYEWTSYGYGHRNVYFLTDDKPILRCVDGKPPVSEEGRSPVDLWRFLEKVGAAAITIPHHPSLTQFPVDWDYYNPRFDRLVEIVSIWGVFEYYGNPYSCMTSNNLPRFFVVDALERGYTIGIIGGGDTHDCRPGDDRRGVVKRNYPKDGAINPLSELHLPYFVHNPLGCGLAAVYAEDTTRESIFDALYRRRAYATVGARIRLEFSINGRLMGEEVTIEDEGERPEIDVRAEGQRAIDRVEIVRNGKVIFKKYGGSPSLSLRFLDEDRPRRRSSYYYVRAVQADGGRAWSSPIWVSYENLNRFDVLYRPERREIVLRNKGKLSQRNVRLALLGDRPFRGRGAPAILDPLEKGTVIWLEEGPGFSVLLRLRFKSSKRPVNFRGCIKLGGVERYLVKPINFAMLKYGGDLFRDSYDDVVEWSITTCSNLTPPG